MRILVTGSREFTDRHIIEGALIDCDEDRLVPLSMGWVPPTVVHGACPEGGADEIADDMAKDLGWVTEPHPAAFKQFGKKAGPIRNQAMVDLGADVCLGFFKRGALNKGTTDCVIRAIKAGIPVRTYWEE